MEREREATNSYKLAIDCRKLGDSHQALKLFEKSLAIYCELGQEHGEAAALGEIGLTHAQSLADAKQVHRYYERSLAVAQRIGAYGIVGPVLAYMGRAYILLRDWEHAVQLLQESLRFLRLAGNRSEEATALVNIAVALHNLGGGSCSHWVRLRGAHLQSRRPLDGFGRIGTGAL
jgi:tetratricopeptide (TPR) repeat protein